MCHTLHLIFHSLLCVCAPNLPPQSSTSDLSTFTFRVPHIPLLCAASYTSSRVSPFTFVCTTSHPTPEEYIHCFDLFLRAPHFPAHMSMFIFLCSTSSQHATPKRPHRSLSSSTLQRHPAAAPCSGTSMPAPKCRHAIPRIFEVRTPIASLLGEK